MAAPLFSVNSHRHDPYRTFKFQIVIDGRTVAGLVEDDGAEEDHGSGQLAFCR